MSRSGPDPPTAVQPLSFCPDPSISGLVSWAKPGQTLACLSPELRPVPFQKAFCSSSLSCPRKPHYLRGDLYLPNTTCHPLHACPSDSRAGADSVLWVNSQAGGRVMSTNELGRRVKPNHWGQKVSVLCSSPAPLPHPSPILGISDPASFLPQSLSSSLSPTPRGLSRESRAEWPGAHTGHQD